VTLLSSWQHAVFKDSTPVTFDSTVHGVYTDIKMTKIYKAKAKFKTKYLFILRANIQNVVLQFECINELGASCCQMRFPSTNISNSPTKFFDSVACASKNCVFEAWINKYFIIARSGDLAGNSTSRVFKNSFK
jgi:hypothetical protein